MNRCRLRPQLYGIEIMSDGQHHLRVDVPQALQHHLEDLVPPPHAPEDPQTDVHQGARPDPIDPVRVRARAIGREHADVMIDGRDGRTEGSQTRREGREAQILVPPVGLVSA